MKDNLDKEELKWSKGSGFGLMNCKGIIEKYKKINDLFWICIFNIESILGKGSCFYFWLFFGVCKIIGICLCLVGLFGFFFC